MNGCPLTSPKKVLHEKLLAKKEALFTLQHSSSSEAFVASAIEAHVHEVN
jgi:hypothetical protein